MVEVLQSEETIFQLRARYQPPRNSRSSHSPDSSPPPAAGRRGLGIEAQFFLRHRQRRRQFQSSGHQFAVGPIATGSLPLRLHLQNIGVNGQGGIVQFDDQPTSCGRVLSNNVKDDKHAHSQQCADLTAQAVEMAARMVLQVRPDLISRADHGFLAKRQSSISGAWRRLVHLFSR